METTLSTRFEDYVYQRPDLDNLEILFRQQLKTLEDAKKVNSIGVMRKSVQHDFLLHNNFTNIEDTVEHIQNIKKLMKGRISLLYHSTQGVAQLCLACAKLAK